MSSELYDVQLLAEAQAQLAALSPPIGGRVWDKLVWLKEHAAEVRHRPLAGDPAGLFKVRVGAYRVIYEIRDECTIVVHLIGHRARSIAISRR